MISTSICKASRIQVSPVSIFKSTDGERVIAVQNITVTDHHGNAISIDVHLEDGCSTLASGETFVFPALDSLTN